MRLIMGGRRGECDARIRAGSLNWKLQTRWKRGKGAGGEGNSGGATAIDLFWEAGMRKKFDRLRIGLLFHSREYYEDYLRDKGEEGEIYLRRCELKFPRECKE